jgi:predicted O-methyltransferase YrrM
MVELRLGSASDTLPGISAERLGPFDLIFIDADKKNIPSYFEWALRLSRPGSIIVVDNVVRDGRVVDSKSDDPDIQGVRRFLEMVGANATVSGTAIQTVGLKGYDGFAIVRVHSDEKRRS